MTVTTQTAARSAENIRVTRSRRNVAWTGLGALVVVVVLAFLPYIVYAGTTTILLQGFVVLTLIIFGTPDNTARVFLTAELVGERKIGGLRSHQPSRT